MRLFVEQLQITAKYIEGTEKSRSFMLHDLHKQELHLFELGYLLFGSAVQPSAIQNVGWTLDFQMLGRDCDNLVHTCSHVDQMIGCVFCCGCVHAQLMVFGSLGSFIYIYI